VRDNGFQAGVDEEVSSAIGVAPPEVGTAGKGGGGPEGGVSPKGRRADFI